MMMALVTVLILSFLSEMVQAAYLTEELKNKLGNGACTPEKHYELLQQQSNCSQPIAAIRGADRCFYLEKIVNCLDMLAECYSPEEMKNYKNDILGDTYISDCFHDIMNDTDIDITTKYDTDYYSEIGTFSYWTIFRIALFCYIFGCMIVICICCKVESINKILTYQKIIVLDNGKLDFQ